MGDRYNNPNLMTMRDMILPDCEGHNAPSVSLWKFAKEMRINRLMSAQGSQRHVGMGKAAPLRRAAKRNFRLQLRKARNSAVLRAFVSTKTAKTPQRNSKRFCPEKIVLTGREWWPPATGDTLSVGCV